MISPLLRCASIVSLLLLFACSKQSADSSSQAETATATSVTANHGHSHSPVMPFHTPQPFTPGPELANIDHNDPAYIRAWSRFNIVDEYRRCGKTNAAWDAIALKGLELYCETRALKNGDPKHDELMDLCREELAKAIAAGCDDPDVRYIHARVVSVRKPDADEEQLRKTQIDCADAIEQTDYAPIRKAWVNLRATESIKSSRGESSNVPPQQTAFKRATIHHLNEALHDPSMPPREAAEITKFTWAMAKSSTVGRYDVEGLLMPTLEKLWPKHAFAYVVRGQFYIDKAWRERGGGWANTVTEKGWKGFEESLELANTTLRKGWKADPTEPEIAISMITVCMGLNYGRPEMEKWFERAMKLNPNSYDAVAAKEFYLEPRWHGSEQQALDFGRECVATKEWGGEVPRILRNTHESLQKYYKVDEAEYYARGYVWRDIQSSYERFFEANPDAVGYRHNYAADAYRSAKYRIFLDQLPLFTTGTNYTFFGGKEKFDDMVKTAMAATDK